MTPSPEPPLVSDAILALLRGMMGQLHTSANREGLTSSQATVFLMLASGRLSSSEVAKNLGLTLPAMTSAVNILSRRGLVRRIRDNRDRRKVWLELTARGRELGRRQAQRFHPLHERVNALVPPDQVKPLSDTLLLIAKEVGAQDAWLSLRCPLCHSSFKRGAEA
jgi:DNA-binding MarR family transcriptional regulator